MKTIRNLLLLISLLIAGATSAQQTETRKVSPFTRLRIGGSFDAVLRQGNEASVKITTENIDPKKIITEAEGNTLKVYLENGYYNNMKIKVEVTYKNLEALDRSGSGNLVCESGLSSTGDVEVTSSGSGNMTIKGPIKGADVTITRSGSGNLKLGGLQASGIQMNFSGSGNFEAGEGNAKTQTIHLTGSGNVNAYGIKTETCSVTVSGSGDIEVSVSNAIEATINGSGNVDYRGNAQVKSIELHGSGRISKKG